MFDRILNLLWITDYFEKFVINEDSFDKIQKSFVYKPGSKTLKVIIPPWEDGTDILTKGLIRRFGKKDCSYITYSFGLDLLSPEIELTLKKFNYINYQVRSDISELKNKYGFERVDVIGTSLGVVSACLITNGNDDVNSLSCIVPGSDLAESLWDGIRTWKLRNTYKSEELNKERLMNAWNDVAPKNSIDKLDGKKIFVAISRGDHIIPYKYGREFADLLKNKYRDVEIEENRSLGHYLTVAKYYLFSKKLLG